MTRARAALEMLPVKAAIALYLYRQIAQWDKSFDMYPYQHYLNASDCDLFVKNRFCCSERNVLNRVSHAHEKNANWLKLLLSSAFICKLLNVANDANVASFSAA